MLLLPSSHWWFGCHKKSTKMVDCPMNLEAWLQDASLFRNEQVEYPIGFDDLLSNEKANAEGDQAILGLSDLGWLDEKVDLSIFDNPNGLLNHSNGTEELMNNDNATLLGFLDGNYNPSYLPSDALKNTEIDLTDCLTYNYTEPASSEIFDSHLASPGCTGLQVNSPVFHLTQSPVSAYSDISDTEETSSLVLHVAETSSTSSDVVNYVFESPEIHVTVFDNMESPSSAPDEELSIEEITNSVRKRRFVNNGDDIPKVKVILKEVPPSAGRSKSKNSREKKKVQNKEAAARYRIKKRIEEKELSDVVFDLESSQKKLQQQHNELVSEIKYLKSLTREILQRNGKMK